jgi:hypothetical protein
MKRLIPLLAGLFAGIMPAFAQMLPDSTVQVVAYWALGDKQKYQVENTKYKIVQGDTTIVEKSAEILDFEVVAADEEKGYRLKVTSLETQYSDPTKEAIAEALEKQLGSVAYYFETDPNGEFLRVLPIEGLEERQETLAQAVWETLKGKKPEVAQFNMLPLIRQSLTPEAVAQTATGEISPLFMYHGNRFDLDEEFPIEDEIPALIGNGTLKMTGQFWVDEELTDDYSVVLRMYKEADQEQLKPLIEGILGNLIQSIAPSPEDSQDAQAAMEDAFRNARMSVNDYLYEEIHLGTGWPLDYSFSREILIEADGQQQNQLVESNIRIIVEE